MSICKLALVLLCIELVGFLVVADEGSDYLDRKEQDVEEIVRLAITNAGQQCELLAACDSPTNCSHDACSMEHTGGSECMDGFNNYFCGTSTNTGSCNSMNLDFSRSYTRHAGTTNLNSVDSMLAICSQKPLEPLFKKISNASVLTRAYFATITGSYRVYPGTPQNADDCRRFDPRIRPWYRTATSVVKIVVVLIDLGASMGNNLPPDLGAGTILQAAKNMAKALLRTMSAQDYVNIIMFDSSRVIQLSPSAVLVQERNETESVETLDVLMSELDKQSVEGQSRQSNISAAILAALPIFDANPKAAKVVVVLTDGVFATLGYNVTVPTAELSNSRVKLFVYKLKQPQDNDMFLRNSTLIPQLCAVGGHFEAVVKNLENPLLAFRHYFSFLASLKRVLTNGRPQYSQLYQNFEPAFVGGIITVSKPVFVDRDLIGVAGISIYIDTLGNITAQVKQALGSRITGYSLAAPEVVLSAANCSLVNETLQPCGSSTAYYAENGGLCKGDDARRRTMQELVCCGTCSAPSPESGSRVSPGAIGGIVGGGVVGIALLVSFLFWLRRRTNENEIGNDDVFPGDREGLQQNNTEEPNVRGDLGHNSLG